MYTSRTLGCGVYSAAFLLKSNEQQQAHCELCIYFNNAVIDPKWLRKIYTTGKLLPNEKPILNMFIVKSTEQREEIIKKSRFIGIITACDSEQQALQYLKDTHEQHSGANHIAFAYRIKSPKGMLVRMHDAGEPSGTAGKPIFQHIEGKNLINILIVVVRYFGGIKLGAGGLTRAYGNCAKLAIEKARLQEYVEFTELTVTVPYSELQQINYHLQQLRGEIVQQNFTEQVALTIRLPKDKLAQLRSLLSI